MTAFPVVKVPRWDMAPISKGAISVSPAITLISSGMIPSTSAAIMAIAVWDPWPISGSPVKSEALPSSSILIKAEEVS